MNFVSSKVAVLSAIAMMASAAYANTPTAQVQRNDGSLATYKLLPVHHDPAHAAVVQARHSDAALKSLSLPASYQIPTAKLPAIRDQGMRGTCAYFATVGLLETYYMTQNKNAKISEECLVDLRNWESDESSYTEADKPDYRPDPNGDLPASIIQTVAAYGVPEANSYSNGVRCAYDGNNTDGGSVALKDYQDVFSGVVSVPSAAYGKGLAFNQNTAPTIDSVKALIAANIPVEVGVILYNEMMYQIDWKYNPKTDTDRNIAGGHAIILTGYTTQNGKTTFTFKNSWSSSWGRGGYGTMDDGLVMNAWGYDPAFDFTTSVKY